MKGVFVFLTSMLVVAIVAMTFVAHGCTPTAPEQRGIQTGNPTVQVDRMFDYQGCTVYRFWDLGKPQYYADCRGVWTR